ncbi:MAG: hypothetical protein QW331_00380 [Candidatus Woesearchaeota archaeon]
MKQKLDRFKIYQRETYNDVLNRLISDVKEPLSSKTIKSIKRALEDIKKGRVHSHEKRAKI